jgi:protein TonB
MLPRTLIAQDAATDGPKPRVLLAAPAGSSGDVALDAVLLDRSMPRRKPLDLFVSVGMHAALIAAVGVAPMFFTREILAGNQITMLATPTLPYAPSPPVAAARAALQKASFSVPKLTVPVAVPKMNQAAQSVAVAAPDLSAGMGGVAGGAPDGVLGGLLGGNGLAGVLPPTGAGTLHVGGQVQRPELVYNPEPEYPSKAKKAKIQGDVRIDAIVDKDGNVVQAHALSGPPVLVDAALKAVSQWKYQPTYLNGSPYPLELIVDINFHLG